jgi:hypothetical protein
VGQPFGTGLSFSHHIETCLIVSANCASVDLLIQINSEDNMKGELMMIYVTLKQAQQIVEAFGGDNESVAVLTRGAPTSHSGEGLYLGWKDYPEEGSEYLGEEEA